MKIDPNAPAFARTGTQFVQDQTGLTIRAYFAGLAKASEIYPSNEGFPYQLCRALMGTNPPDYEADPIGNSRWHSAAYAKWQVQQADALIDALNGAAENDLESDADPRA